MKSYLWSFGAWVLRKQSGKRSYLYLSVVSDTHIACGICKLLCRRNDVNGSKRNKISHYAKQAETLLFPSHSANPYLAIIAVWLRVSRLWGIVKSNCESFLRIRQISFRVSIGYISRIIFKYWYVGNRMRAEEMVTYLVIQIIFNHDDYRGIFFLYLPKFDNIERERSSMISPGIFDAIGPLKRAISREHFVQSWYFGITMKSYDCSASFCGSIVVDAERRISAKSRNSHHDRAYYYLCH